MFSGLGCLVAKHMGRMQNPRLAKFTIAVLACVAAAGCGGTVPESDENLAEVASTPPPAGGHEDTESKATPTAEPEATRTPRPKVRLSSCDANIRVKVSTTTCAFAQNVFYEYWASNATSDTTELEAYSEAGTDWIALACDAGAIVRCTANDGSDIRFPSAAIDRYTADNAATYASSHRVSTGREKRNDSADARVTAEEVCLPETRLRAVHLPEVRLPAVTLPAYTDFDGVRHPARRIPGRRIAGRTIPARTIGGQCFEVPSDFAPEKTSVLTQEYERLDPGFSSELSKSYWDESGDASLVPDYTAKGFGEVNAAGFPKNQYVRPYVRRDGTYISGYWRNSPTDGLPTCRIISC